jgi:hypothetical protein
LSPPENGGTIWIENRKQKKGKKGKTDECISKYPKCE